MDEIQRLLESIQEQIKTAVTKVQYVDENWGQLDYFGPEIPVKWPCVLLDINQGQFTNIGRDNNVIPANRQQGNLMIELTIASLKLTNTSFNAPKKQKRFGFEIWQLADELHQKLHGWQPVENSGGLIRASVGKIRRDDGVQEIRVIYSLEIHNC